MLIIVWILDKLEVTHFSDRFCLMLYFLHHVHHHPSHRKLDVHHHLYPDVLPLEAHSEAVFKMFKITLQCLCSSSALPRCSALWGALWGCVASSVEAWRCRTGAEYDDYHYDSHHDDIRVEGHGPDNAVKGLAKDHSFWIFIAALMMLVMMMMNLI